MSLLNLEDAKDHLGIKNSDDDTRLQRVLDAAERRVASLMGMVPPTLDARTLTRIVRSMGGSLVLPVSATAVTTVDGVAPTSPDLSFGVLVNTADPVYGYRLGTLYTVVYTEGWATADAVPADVVLAVFELTRHMWQPVRGPMARGAESTQAPGYLIPNRVRELLADYTLPGFA